MSAGKENENKRNENTLQSNSTRNKVADASKPIPKPMKRPIASTHATTATIKTKSTTATATKITKLVLKPKPVATKSSLTSKVTSQKYITKPVAIKSRSTMISHESTFRIRNIKKASSPSERQKEKSEVILVNNSNISQQLIVDGNNSKVNETVALHQQPFDMVHSEHSANITSLNVTKVVTSPVLQEITSTVVNGSNFAKISKEHELGTNVLTNVTSPQKTVNNCENDGKNKAKSYDPIKARQFIRMQKEKRRESEIEKSKTPATKEEIKQRLSALRKNTLKIVEKNVQKARKSVNTNDRNSKSFTPKINKGSSPSATQKQREQTGTKSAPNVLKTPQLARLQSKVSPSLALTPSKFLPSIKSDKNRIGILRRPEGVSPTIEPATHIPEALHVGSANVEQHSESNINIDISLDKSTHNSTFRNEPRLCEFELKVPETVPLTSSLLHELSSHGFQDEVQHDNKDEGQHCEDTSAKPRDIPYWLRPTPVQPYPYNFIMAVRKKLESITHPVVSIKQRQWPNHTEHTSYHNSPLARPDTMFESRYRQNLDRQQSESDRSMSEQIQSSDVSPQKSSKHIENSGEQDEYSSAVFESERSRSNVLFKSKRKSVGGSQDTLSISSGILSHSSPEKKRRSTTTNGTRSEKDEKPWQPIPLTTDNVDGLQIISRSSLQNERISNANSAVSHQSAASTVTSHLNFRRGKDYSGRGLPTFEQLSEQQSLAQLLDDFKTSLSAAIDANQQLRDLLSNPPSSRLTQYSDDFEQSSGNKQSHIIERINDSNSKTSPKSKYTESTVQSNGQVTEDKITSVTENGASHGNLSTATRVVGTHSNISSNMSYSKQNYSERIGSNDFEDSQEKKDDEVEVEEESTRVPKESSTLIEEKIDDYQSSESPTNNDLKSVSLSIAKKSAPTTSDDTDQPSNAIESYSKQIIGDADVANESIGSDIFNIFNKTTGLSLMDNGNQSIWSEHNISYSTLGMCDQLLKSETRKSEDLAALLKIREKSLIDRFKGQIAWLELQKQKFKESGLTSEISMIKKKQRALLLRLNNDRKELHRILKERQQSDAMRNSSIVNFNISHMSTNMSIRKTSISKPPDSASAKRALKAIELSGGGAALETMLQKRENELRRRREHVEKLLRWHQRLDVEEREVIKMEQMIMYISTSDVYQTTTSREQINDTLAITVHSKRMNCQRDEISVHERSLTNVSDLATMEKTRFEHRKQKQIHKIEKSLNTLKLISSRSISSDIDGSNVDDVVEIFGRQLNKLWKRLTGEYEKKYTPDKVYTLSKSDLELLYEEAKCVVLKQFHKNDEFKRRLIDNSVSIIDESQRNSILRSQLAASESNIEKKSSEQETIVPTLNLASSPEPKENAISDTDQGYYFSNNSTSEQISEQQKQQTKTDVPSGEASTLDGTSGHLESSQLQTEQPVEEDDQSESIQEEVQSDITEDSLNKPKTISSEDVSPSDIRTISHANETRSNENGTSSLVPSVIETSHTTVPFELNISENNTQLIEETSFPNIDIQTTISSVVESDMSSVSANSVSPVKKSMSNISSRPSDEQKYQSDDFEDGKSAEELTSISTATVTKIATTTTTAATSSALATESTEQTVTPKTESPKELEQRLIQIDDGLKEIHEIISHSPVLQSDRETGNSSESIESRKSTGTKSPSSDNELKADDENKSTKSGKSDEKSETDSEKTVEHDTPTESIETEPSVETNETPKNDSDESTDSIAAEIAASKTDNQTPSESMAQKRPYQYTLSAGSIDYNKVPEADALKRSQVPLETEIKAAEQASVMFPFLREIPNKPPPPYPVHRQLPKTPPFPSDDRIKEIVNRRVEEFFLKLNSTEIPETPVRSDATFTKSPSLSSTASSIASPESPAVQAEVNVFERIILDSCDEIMQEISVPERQLDPEFRMPLEFYNPPDRLKCFQQHTIKRIFKLLNRPTASDASNGGGDGEKSYTGMRSFLPSQVAQLTFNNRRKRDAVDEILIQELYEDEARWTNFDLEEKEIRNNVTDLRTLLADDSSGAHETSMNATNTE